MGLLHCNATQREWCLQPRALQLSNARIMNKGTDHNIMTQLGMTSDEYNLVTVLYYVSTAGWNHCLRPIVTDRMN
jgi:hypothetical protein